MQSIVLKMAAVALGGVALVGCAAQGELKPTAASDLQQALGVGCPILGAVQSSNLSLNTYQKSALGALALACPPNPPPSSAVVAAEDIIAAYVALQPLLKH